MSAAGLEQLRAAVAALVTVAEHGQLDEGSTRAEAAALAATLSESAVGAAPEWAAALDLPIDRYGEYAVAGRRWRRQPTAQLTTLVSAQSPHAPAYARALVDVASAASSLGESSLRAIERATLAAQSQLRAANVNPEVIPTVGGFPAGAIGGLNSEAGEKSTGASIGVPIASPVPVSPPAVPETPKRPLEALLAELDELVGLDTVKSEVRRQAQVLRMATMRAEHGLKVPDINRHLVFVGNPGTGKTTVARLVAEIYFSMGLLRTGQMVETERAGLVAGYVGQTALKTTEVIKKALGGVLFVDEAYALASDDFGHEAVDTLVKALEDHRDDLVVIVAGYPGPMVTFIEANPGLESRFRLTLEFADYSDGELVTIFSSMATKADFAPTPAAVNALRTRLAAEPRGVGFGNARFVRNVFEGAVVHQAWRLRDVADPSVDQLRILESEDVLSSDGEADAKPPEPTIEGTVSE